jgi:hypothetical protein
MGYLISGSFGPRNLRYVLGKPTRQALDVIAVDSGRQLHVAFAFEVCLE